MKGQGPDGMSDWGATLSTILSDLELARRLEEAESFAAEAFVRQVAVRRPDADLAVEDVVGGRAVYAGAGSPLTEAKAIGLHGPVTEADLDRMEAVFFPRGESSRVVVCPLADPSMVQGLGRRGYRLSHFENILVLPLQRDDPEPPPTPGIDVRPVGPGEVDLYARVVAPNFVGEGESVEDVVEMAATMSGVEHAASFLARIDGQPVGGGAVFIHRGLALLAGAATLPPFRNRGVHAALHHARLALARHSGCDLAAQGALPGSTSQRNAERRGLRVAYTRAILVRDPA
jgi:GNAT superfamily N-acetyltransferase